MARATWSGTISFGLVNVPVKLFTGTRSHGVSFHQLHERTGARVRRRRVDAETGEEVPSDEIVKGWEVADGEHVLVDPDELDALSPEASRSIQLLDFVDLADIEPVYYDRAYYLAPDGEAARKPYALLVQAMARTGRAAIARFVMRGNEYLAAVRPRDGVLLLSTMHYADEVVDPSELEIDTDDIELGDRELDMAEELIGTLTTGFVPEDYRDLHHERVLEHLEALAAGEDVRLSEPTQDTGGDVVDLMAALEQSLAAGSRAIDDDRDWSSMTKDELYELAQERDLPGRSSMTRDELETALRAPDRAAG